jgi:hypothetical protein
MNIKDYMSGLGQQAKEAGRELSRADSGKKNAALLAFLDGTQAVAFSVPGHKKARYYFIQSSLKQFHYRALTKRQKGIIIRFLFFNNTAARCVVTLVHFSQQSNVSRCIGLFETSGFVGVT